MGSCCSCLNRKIELQDVLISEENLEGFHHNNNSIATSHSMITIDNNSVTNTVVATFVDPNASNSKTDFTMFPFLKHHLINIPFDLNDDLFKMPPIGTVLDEKNSYSIVLFGDTDTGKTTFFNQFRLYIDDFSESERKSYVLRIMASIIESIQKIYVYLKGNDKNAKFENEKILEELSNLKMEEIRKSYTIPPDLFGKVKSAWNDPIISKTFSEQWKARHLCQFVPDFISNISKYEPANYVPENSEILQTKMCTINNNINNRISDENYLATASLSTSPQMLAFSFLDMILLLRDAGGLKSHRDKWKSFNFDGGFFFVSLSDFNQPVLEDDSSNLKSIDSSESLESSSESQINEYQIFESLKIFKKTISKFFPTPQKPLFVLLTKYDLFIKIIENDPNCFLKVFPDFTGVTSDPDQCQKYIGNMFAKAAKECNPDLKIDICTSINCLNKTSVFYVTKKIVKKIKKY